MNPLHVAHDIPGRLRLRLAPGAPTDGLTAAISAETGVIHCTWSERTRSLLVLYDPQHGDRAAIVEAVAQLTGLDRPVESANGSGTPPQRPEAGALLVSGVREIVGEVDQRVHRTTRGLLGLGTLLPVALVTWSIAQVVRGRATPLSWTSALWYAHGLVRDYQIPTPRD
jgi:Heavy metal associated domain 2